MLLYSKIEVDNPYHIIEGEIMYFADNQAFDNYSFLIISLFIPFCLSLHKKRNIHGKRKKSGCGNASLQCCENIRNYLQRNTL